MTILVPSTSFIANLFTHLQFGTIRSYYSSLRLLRRVDVATGNSALQLAAADFDGDGKSDIAVTYFNALSSFVSVYRNTSTSGSISFTAPVNLPCLKNGYNIAAQDLDGDGKAEIVVMHQPNPPAWIVSHFFTYSVLCFMSRSRSQLSDHTQSTSHRYRRYQFGSKLIFDCCLIYCRDN